VLSIEFSAPFQTSFSTEAMYSALHWELPLLLPCGYHVSQGSMIFGLAAVPAANLSLSSMLDFLCLPKNHLLALDTEAKLVLDTAPASRNAIWFTPWDNCETVLRLQIDPHIIFAVPVTRAGGSPIETIFTFEMDVMTIIMRPSDGTLLEFFGWMADLAGADSKEVREIDDWVRSVSKKLPKVLELQIQATAAGHSSS
jgi:hypothetical protein